MKKQFKKMNLNSIKILNVLKFFSFRISVLVVLMFIEGDLLEINAQRLSRDLNVDLLVNQVGYVPQAEKQLLQKE